MYDEFEFESSNDSADDYSISEVENEEEFTENELLVPVPYINVRTEQPVSTTQTELDFTEEQIWEEIQNIWREKGIIRKRVSKLDREAARRNLKRRRGDVSSESSESDENWIIF